MKLAAPPQPRTVRGLLWNTATELKYYNLEMSPLSGAYKAPLQTFRRTDPLPHSPPATVTKTAKDLHFMKDKKNAPVPEKKKV